ncbi:Trk system potassium uptake protein TrkA [Cutibacterium acnes JCM 18916]|nr:Trk system potassium uptake protein TrkA [Cutibacterium acnes JCM 18916]
MVREEFGIDNVVARIYDQGRAEVYERLGIPTVATVRWAADQVLRSLMPEGSEPAWRDPSGQVRLIRVNTHTDWVGMKISAIQERIHTPLPFFIEIRSRHGPRRSHLAAGWRRSLCRSRGRAHHRNRGPIGQAAGQTLIVTDNAVHPRQGES